MHIYIHIHTHLVHKYKFVHADAGTCTRRLKMVLLLWGVHTVMLVFGGQVEWVLLQFCGTCIEEYTTS